MKTVAKQVQEAWQAAQSGFVFTGKPTVWSVSVQELQQSFVGHFGAAYVEKHFRVPDDYGHFMQMIGGGWHRPQRLGLSLYDAGTVIRASQYDFKLFYTGTDDKKPAEPLDEGLWLRIGLWSDRHDYLLACDPTQLAYGQVIDGHDSHPWLNGLDFGGCRVVAGSFLDFLRYLTR